MTTEAVGRVKDVLKESGGVFHPADCEPSLTFSRIVYDSRKVIAGSAFFCVPGEKTNGNEFVADAIARGATCIVSEHTHPGLRVPQITVPDVRLALASASKAYFDDPSKKMRLIGITGTNGKTTTTHLIESILNACGKPCALLGTLGARWPGFSDYGEAKHTTPQAPELQELLGKMASSGCTHVAMEVSSHSLSLKRVAGCHFSVALLTNLTQDHLDFHKTMEHYWRSKKLLFESLAEEADENSVCVVNLDDPIAKEFLAVGGSKLKKLTYGYSGDAEIRVLSEEFARGLNNLSLQTPAGKLDLKLRLVGRFNTYNAMAAVAVCLHEGADRESIVNTLANFPGVPGRFEIVSSGEAKDEPLCIVDYAHTPDGLENVLKTAAGLKNAGSKLFAVFGCGGDRDPSKRPKMGDIAERLADEVIVTSDNPRTEDPQEIIANILTGIKRVRHVEVEPDRATAIRIAINRATEKDIVVIAGKGHENYQLVMNQVLSFDDKVEVLKALQERESVSTAPDTASKS